MDISLEQFTGSEEIINYFNGFSYGSRENDPFFNDERYTSLFLQCMSEKKITISEHEYIIPQRDYREKNDLDLGNSRNELLNHFRGQGSSIKAVRKSLLMFINPNLSELELYPGNIIVDHKSASAILTGSVTLLKLCDFLSEFRLSDVNTLYVFPYHCNATRKSPFQIERYWKIIFSKDIKMEFAKVRDDSIRNNVMNMIFAEETKE